MSAFNEVVADWLDGVGRSDLARKARRRELPEIETQHAHQQYSRVFSEKIDRNEYFRDVLGLEIVPPPVRPSEL